MTRFMFTQTSLISKLRARLIKFELFVLWGKEMIRLETFEASGANDESCLAHSDGRTFKRHESLPDEPTGVVEDPFWIRRPSHTYRI